MQIVILWFPVIFWCSIIFFFSSIPNLKIEALGIWDLILRKIAHIAEFGILSALIYRAIKRTIQESTREEIFSVKIHNRVYFWSGFLSFVYAVSDEYHQFYVQGRYPAITDVLIDTFGIVLVLSLIKYHLQQKQSQLLSV